MERWVVCLGGTFSPLHKGHLMLLEKAFSVGRVVRVGLTSDRFATRGRRREVAPYEEREVALRKALDPLSDAHDVPYTIGMITDRIGFAHEPAIEAIVVSKETERTVELIDAERARKGLPPLVRFVMDMVLDDRGQAISSTRVHNAEVDASGRTTSVKERGGP